MAKLRVLVKYGTYAAVISICMIVIAYLATVWMTEQDATGMLRRNSRILTVQNLVESIPPEKRATELSQLESHELWQGFRSVYLLSEKGEILYPIGARDFSRSSTPAPLFSMEKLAQKTIGDAPRVWVDLNGEPRQHLLIERTPIDAALFGWRLSIAFVILSLALVVGVVAAMLVTLYFLRGRVNTAFDVISQIKGGDLKARFPVTKMDEFAHTALLFNQMADEIETLVSSLRETERSRSSLLQELAHDLRTPVAGLKTLLETLSDQAAKLTPEKTAELVRLAECEVDYFGSLVEDLLLLGTLDEPTYKPETVNLGELLQKEIDSFAQRFPDCEVKLFREGELDPATGNPRLLRRAVRNALENACAYARKKIDVRVRSGRGEVVISVEDDGPGFSEADLLQFGTKRPTRLVSQRGAKRISVGLGSVIMKSIAERHRGHIRPRNRIDGQGRVEGASVDITLPQKTGAP